MGGVQANAPGADQLGGTPDASIGTTGRIRREAPSGQGQAGAGQARVSGFEKLWKESMDELKGSPDSIVETPNAGNADAPKKIGKLASMASMKSVFKRK